MKIFKVKKTNNYNLYLFPSLTSPKTTYKIVQIGKKFNCDCYSYLCQKGVETHKDKYRECKHIKILKKHLKKNELHNK